MFYAKNMFGFMYAIDSVLKKNFFNINIRKFQVFFMEIFKFSFL